MHDAPQDVLVDAYPEEEFWQDLLKVTGGRTDESLARLVIRASAKCRPWMRSHGVRFQPSLSGALHTARTNAFFMGGGKALVNAYYRSAEQLGVQIRYDAPVDRLELQDGRFVAAFVQGQRIEARACVLAAGGFESNRAWLREAWGQNDRGEWPADNFLIRGTRFNDGTCCSSTCWRRAPTPSAMRHRRTWWPSTRALRCTTVASAPASTACRWAWWSMPRRAASTTKGEDFWPKRYAIWGRLVARQPGQIAYSIIDAKAQGRFMPPVFPGRHRVHAACLGRPRWAWTWPPSCRRWTPTTLPAGPAISTTRCWTTAAPKAWPPPRPTGRCRWTSRRFTAYAVRPGVTFTYLGLKTDATAAVRFGGRASPNLFVAGEMMAGNVLGQGYTAGVGMSIGTAFGRIAGISAALAVGKGAAPAVREGAVHADT